MIIRDHNIYKAPEDPDYKDPEYLKYRRKLTKLLKIELFVLKFCNLLKLPLVIASVCLIGYLILWMLSTIFQLLPLFVLVLIIAKLKGKI